MRNMITIPFILALFLCIPIAHATGGQWYLLSPKMILRMDANETPYVGSIGIRNTDPLPVDITLDVPDDFNNIIFFEDSDLNFTLEPETEMWINFTVNPETPKNVSGDVVVMFTPREENVTGAALASEIHLVMQDVIEDAPETDSDPMMLYLMIAAVVVIIAIFIIIKRR